MENAGGHKISDEIEAALPSVNTEVLSLPNNSTDIYKSADSFIIQNIKSA